ncbi:MAG: hypothetical protein PSU94_15270 [Lacunisphaera sp.]|nr:hypothetical protein [Lacunisphaera sp.]
MNSRVIFRPLPSSPAGFLSGFNTVVKPGAEHTMAAWAAGTLAERL